MNWVKDASFESVKGVIIHIFDNQAVILSSPVPGSAILIIHWLVSVLQYLIFFVLSARPISAISIGHWFVILLQYTHPSDLWQNWELPCLSSLVQSCMICKPSACPTFAMLNIPVLQYLMSPGLYHLCIIHIHRPVPGMQQLRHFFCSSGLVQPCMVYKMLTCPTPTMFDNYIPTRPVPVLQYCDVTRPIPPVQYSHSPACPRLAICNNFLVSPPAWFSLAWFIRCRPVPYLQYFHKFISPRPVPVLQYILSLGLYHLCSVENHRPDPTVRTSAGTG